MCSGGGVGTVRPDGHLADWRWWWWWWLLTFFFFLFYFYHILICRCRRCFNCTCCCCSWGINLFCLVLPTSFFLFPFFPPLSPVFPFPDYVFITIFLPRDGISCENSTHVFLYACVCVCECVNLDNSLTFICYIELRNSVFVIISSLWQDLHAYSRNSFDFIAGSLRFSIFGYLKDYLKLP